MPAAGLHILQATLRPGRTIRIIDISPSGIQLETDRGLRPGSIAHIRLVSDQWTLVAAGVVVRCEVSAIGGEAGVTYRGALQFEERCAAPPFTFTPPSPIGSAESTIRAAAPGIDFPSPR